MKANIGELMTTGEIIKDLKIFSISYQRKDFSFGNVIVYAKNKLDAVKLSRFPREVKKSSNTRYLLHQCREVRQ